MEYDSKNNQKLPLSDIYHYKNKNFKKNKPIISNIDKLLLNNKTPDPNVDLFVKNYKNNIISDNIDNLKKLDFIKCDKISKSKTTPYLFVNTCDRK